TASSVPPRFLPARPPARPRPEREVPPARTPRPPAPHHLLDTRGSTHRCRVTDRRRTAVAHRPLGEQLPALQMAPTALQHVAALTFLTGACLFTAGLATLLQTLGIWRIGARLPFVNGVTFAGVAPMTAIVAATDDKDDALPVIFGAVIVAGLLGFLAAPFFSKAVRFFPPVGTGTVITLIGVPLLPVAFGWAQGADPSAGDFGSATNLALAAGTLVIVLLRRFTRGFVKQIAILLGMVAGTLLAIPFGVTDFSPVAQADVVG